MKQINNFKEKKSVVDMKDGSIVKGHLAFFNYEEQVIHVEDYAQEKYHTKDELEIITGEFIVINKLTWDNLRVGKRILKQD